MSGHAGFVRSFSARYGGQFRIEMLGVLNHQSASAYAAALVTQQAIEAAGTFDRAAIRHDQPSRRPAQARGFAG